MNRLFKSNRMHTKFGNNQTDVLVKKKAKIQFALPIFDTKYLALAS